MSSPNGTPDLNSAHGNTGGFFGSPPQDGTTGVAGRPGWVVTVNGVAVGPILRLEEARLVARWLEATPECLPRKGEG